MSPAPAFAGMLLAAGLYACAVHAAGDDAASPDAAAGSAAVVATSPARTNEPDRVRAANPDRLDRTAEDGRRLVQESVGSGQNAAVLWDAERCAAGLAKIDAYLEVIPDEFRAVYRALKDMQTSMKADPDMSELAAAVEALKAKLVDKESELQKQVVEKLQTDETYQGLLKQKAEISSHWMEAARMKQNIRLRMENLERDSRSSEAPVGDL